MGDPPLGATLKVGVLDVWSNPSLLREKLGLESPLLIVWHRAKGGVASETVSGFSTHFIVDIFSVTQCVGVTQLGSGFL